MLTRFSRLRPYFVRNRKVLALGSVFLILANYFDIKVLVLLGEGTEAVTWDLGPFSFLRSGVMGSVMIAVLVAALAGAVARFWMRQLIIGTSREIEFSLRNDLFRHLQRLSPSFFNRYPTGDLMARATNDLEAVRQVIGPGIMYLASTAVMVPMCLYQMIRISSTLTLITWLPLIMIAPLFYFFKRRILLQFTRVQEAFSDISTRVQETLTGIRVIKAYAREDQEAGRFDDLSQRYVRANIRLTILQAFFIPLLNFVVGLSLLALITAGGLLIAFRESLSLGELIAFFLLLIANIWPLAAIGWVFSLIERGAASMARLDELFEAEPEIVDTEAPAGAQVRMEGRIKITGLTFTYPGADQPVLHNLNVDLAAGATLGLTGPVGSAKSTLAELLARRYNPPRGTIIVDGTDLLDWPLKEYRSQVSIVDQEPFIFGETIRANIGYGLPPNETNGSVESKSEIAQLAKDIGEFPNGFETVLGERGINLSGGQRQRAALARALVTEPAVLILDDALAAVDAETEELILRGLREFMKGRTTLLISHRVRTVSLADHIIYLDAGRVIEEGSHEELMSHKGEYWRLAHKQKLAEEIESTA